MALADRTPAWLQGLGVLVLSLTVACAATVTLSSVAESRGWCCVHGWALAHGTGVVVFMAFALIGYHAVKTIGTRTGLLSPSPQFGWLPHIAYVGGALGTFLPTDEVAFVGLAAGVLALSLRLRRKQVRPFGIAIVGLLVSLLAATYWLYLEIYLPYAVESVG